MKQINRLSARGVISKRKPGYYADGGGLYLQVSDAGTKSWIFRYMLKTLSKTGKPMSREMGLGSLITFTLEEARERATAQRKLLADGIDPIEARKARRAQESIDAGKIKTFDECAAAYIKTMRSSWKNKKHAEQWQNTIATYASPTIGKLPVHLVDVDRVVKVLDPIWTKKRETAGRLRGRIEKILNWAKGRGYRSGDNPAAWRGTLENQLPKQKRSSSIEHHPALPWKRIAKLIGELRKQEGVSARALEFTILTASRTSEVLLAKPAEFDFAENVWNVPKERMKGEITHRVPLSPRAAEIVKAMMKEHPGEFVFPGRDNGPLSNMAMLELLRRMGYGDFTVHGFRSTFRDWTADETNYTRSVCEAALAHKLKDLTEASYRRTDLLERRRPLMLDWAKFCEPDNGAGKVLPMRRKGNTAPAGSR